MNQKTEILKMIGEATLNDRSLIEFDIFMR